jgi:hypothetical protein
LRSHSKTHESCGSDDPIDGRGDDKESDCRGGGSAYPTFNTYGEGKLTLEEHLGRVVFCIQFAPFVADHGDLQRVPDLELSDQLDHPRVNVSPVNLLFRIPPSLRALIGVLGRTSTYLENESRPGPKYGEPTRETVYDPRCGRRAEADG